MTFPSIKIFTAMLADPFYGENVVPDDANFADMSRTKYVSLSLWRKQPLAREEAERG
jgi:hypothetical protein